MTVSFKTIHVFTRFGLRILVLCVFSAFGDLGFSRTFTSLLLLSAIVCVFTGLLRGEHPLAGTLTNWDEAAVYGMLCALTAAINQAASL
jgi:hypothetical protein